MAEKIRPFVTTQHIVRGDHAPYKCPKCQLGPVEERFYLGERYRVCLKCGHSWED